MRPVNAAFAAVELSAVLLEETLELGVGRKALGAFEQGSEGSFWISCIFERISSTILSASPSSMMPLLSSSLAQISRTVGWSRMISYIFGWV